MTIDEVSRLRSAYKILLFICIIAFTNACTIGEARYSQYVPIAESLYKITFVYPSDWEWDENLHSPDFNSADIRVSDPDSPDIYKGSVDIFVITDTSVYALGNYPERDATQQMEADISNFLTTQKTIRSEILSNQIFEIDGHYARRIISKSGPKPPRAELPAQTEAMVMETIYILDQDRYYIVYFSIPESQRNGDFGKGYDALINSIEFIR